MRNAFAMIGALLSISVAAHSANAFDWDTDQGNLGWHAPMDFDSWSRVKAQLPTDLAIEPIPAASPFARLSGTWHGWECGGRHLDSKFAFTGITASGASLVMALASDQWGNTHLSRYEIQQKDDGFSGVIYSYTYEFRLRPQQVQGYDVLEFQAWRHGGRECYGVLIKDRPN